MSLPAALASGRLTVNVGLDAAKRALDARRANEGLPPLPVRELGADEFLAEAAGTPALPSADEVHGLAPADELHRFATGAVRSKDAGAYRYDLITPIGLRRLAETYAEGARKYGAGNWEKGFPIHDSLNHAIRHIYLYLGGDRTEDHLAHAAWNLMASIHSEEMWPHLNEGHLRRGDCVPPTVTDEEAAAWRTTP